MIFLYSEQKLKYILIQVLKVQLANLATYKTFSTNLNNQNTVHIYVQRFIITMISNYNPLTVLKHLLYSANTSFILKILSCHDHKKLNIQYPKKKTKPHFLLLLD